MEDKTELNFVIDLLKQTPYAVHPYMKSHNGFRMSFGYGMVNCNSSEHKPNTNISTEAKLVGMSKYSPYNIWICLFMGSQGNHIKQKNVFHDNQSAIKMGVNR